MTGWHPCRDISEVERSHVSYDCELGEIEGRHEDNEVDENNWGRLLAGDDIAAAEETRRAEEKLLQGSRYAREAKLRTLSTTEDSRSLMGSGLAIDSPSQSRRHQDDPDALVKLLQEFRYPSDCFALKANPNNSNPMMRCHGLSARASRLV